MRVDMGRMESLRRERLITIARHPDLPISILNYTPKCQYDGAWTPETIMCRGLVVEDDGRVVARPFPKFFNWDEHGRSPILPPVRWDQPFVATEKLDGSLGIVFRHSGRWHTATRGSFSSRQADEARAIWARLGYRHDGLHEGRTYLFEIISPKTRVVVNYGDSRELVLLDVVETATGSSVPFGDLAGIAAAIGCRPVNRIPMASADPSTLAEFAASGVRNAEGVVIRFDDGTRVKAKFDDYKRLHRLVTGVNSRAIWEMLRDGKPLDDLLDRVPDEYFRWVRDVARKLQSDRLAIVAESALALEATRGRLGDAPRRDYAAAFAGRASSAVLFRMLDGKPYDDITWRLVRPEVAVPFVSEDESA